MTETRLEELWARYSSLWPADRFAFEVRCLVYPDLPAQGFQRLLEKLEPFEPSGTRVKLSGLAAFIQRMRQGGLLGPNLSPLPALRHRVAVAATSSVAGRALATAMRERLRSIGFDQLILERCLTVAVYASDADAFAELLDMYGWPSSGERRDHVLVRLFKRVEVTPDWLTGLAPLIQAVIFNIRLQPFLSQAIQAPDLAPLVAAYAALPDAADTLLLKHTALQHRLLCGAVSEVAASLPAETPADGWLAHSLRGQLHLLADRPGPAASAFRTALKLKRKLFGKRKLFLGGVPGMFFLLTLLRLGDAAALTEMQTMLDGEVAAGTLPLRGAVALQAWLFMAQGQQQKAASMFEQRAETSSEPIGEVLAALAGHAFDSSRTAAEEAEFAARFAALQHGPKLLAHIYAALLVETSPSPAHYRAFLDAADPAITLPFAEITRPSQPWERALDSIAGFLSGPPAPEAKARRLVWLVHPDQITVEAVEQTRRGRDGWSDGRPAPMKRLFDQDPRLTYLADHDRRVLRMLRRNMEYPNEHSYFLDPVRALPALIGHPLVFDARRRDVRIELVSYPVELVVAEQAGGWRISLSHAARGERVFLEAETPTRFRVIVVTPDLAQLHQLLGDRGLRVPTAGRDRVLALLKRNAPTLPVCADWAEDAQPGIEGIAAPVVQLMPDGEGLRANLMVRPFGPDGPAYVAGLGGRSVLASLSGAAPRRALRDLDREIGEREALVAACPTLRDRRAADAHEVAADDLESALELLGELAAYPGGVAVEWPQGRAFKVSTAAQNQVKLKITQQRDWFAVDGTVTLDDGQVLEMRLLLDRLASGQGRFIRLDDGRFVALTRQFQAQLQRLAAISEPDKQGRKLHRLAAPALQDLLGDGADVQTDAGWQRQVARVREAAGFTPRLPSTLQCELRDYQAEGFMWLSRLAQWGAGACLADDMGLGKTVQAIAVLLDRAAGGPSLVVAPTSVCGNWAIELDRFAPSLAVHRLTRTWTEAALAALGPRDILLCSYNMLQQNADRLGALVWRVAVLDEAQAIKNAETKRAQASLRLQADFRLALSGTPIENYLDELWSLFHFLNPGLLGSREAFAKKFAGPIERDRDPAARHGLKALIRPFILRRTKADVLSELPPRIEQTVLVEMDAQERAFYEALRQRALQRLAALDAKPGARRIHMLAEIMRLRRACCNPALIEPEAALPSAKLAAFLELVDELLRNGHKALVFSQFVGHLHLVRAALQQRQVSLQYLDGSTPSAERDRLVAAFQGGAAALFLISLKAGGSGLNLTAADYVIHLDPWWNPAVEDQASDRAHRIGQDRPVTIYRLIMQDTIEERIVSLHRDKRDLASALLEGSEVSARLDENELLALIRSEAPPAPFQLARTSS